MIRFRSRDVIVDRVDANGLDLDLISAETTLLIGRRGFGWGATYRRPVRVGVADRAPVAIRDLVMISRLVALVVVLLLATRRSRRE